MGDSLSRILSVRMLFLEVIAVIQPEKVVNAGSNSLIGCGTRYQKTTKERESAVIGNHMGAVRRNG